MGRALRSRMELSVTGGVSAAIVRRAEWQMQMLKYLVILAAAAVLDSCSLNLLAPKYTVGGTVTGVVGTGLVLQVNSGDNLGIVTQGSFTFGSSIAKGDTYTVT